MTNIEQTIKAQREHIIKEMAYDINFSTHKTIEEKILGLNSQSIKQILEVLVEEEWGEMFANTSEAGQFALHADGFNQAKEETIEKLKEAIALLDKREL